MTHRIGILGAAAIAPTAVMLPAKRRNDVVIQAVASRRPGAAAAYAEINGIPVAYETYAALIADPDIGIIYNALPPAGHAEWTIAALKAGKHVLCEKPFAMNGEQARRMVEAADISGKILMEALHSRYHPAFLHLLDLRASGRLGRVKSIRAEFLVEIPYEPKSIRHDPVQGGGAMMDLGCYTLHWIRSFMGSEPEILSAEATLNPLGIDQSMHIDMRFAGGASGEIIADMTSPPFRALLRVEAENGVIELQNPCAPHVSHSIREWIDGEPYREHTVAGATSYDYQLAAMIGAIESGVAPATGGIDPIGNMTAIDSIYAKAGINRSYPV